MQSASTVPDTVNDQCLFHNTKYVDVSTEITKVIKGLLRTSQILQDGHT